MQSLQEEVSSLAQSEKLWQNPSSGKKVNHLQDWPRAWQAARHANSSAATDEPTSELSIHFPGIKMIGWIKIKFFSDFKKNGKRRQIIASVQQQ